MSTRRADSAAAELDRAHRWYAAGVEHGITIGRQLAEQERRQAEADPWAVGDWPHGRTDSPSSRFVARATNYSCDGQP